MRSGSTLPARSTTTSARASASPSASSPDGSTTAGRWSSQWRSASPSAASSSLTLLTVHDVHINWIWFALGFWIVAWAISVLGVRISTRAQLVLALVSVAIVFAWAVYVVLKGGSSGFSLRPFNPSEASFKGITFGIVYAGLIFVGFESAANLAEETAEPRRNIPRAIFYSVVAATVFYVVLAWALLLAFGLNVAEMLKSFPPLYAATANPDFGGDRFSELVQWLVVIDIAAVGLGTSTGTTRGIFALARDRHLPSVLAAVHPRYKTPYVAATAIAVVAVVVALIVRISSGLAPGTPPTLPGTGSRSSSSAPPWGRSCSSASTC